MHITSEKITLEEFFSHSPDPRSGAMAAFVGMVRNHDHGSKVQELYYECYIPMANKQIASLILEVKTKWPVEDIRVLHRVGVLKIGETAVAIAVNSSHRPEAFAACRFMIERIKTEVPIWKKQIFEDGSSEWALCSHSEHPAEISL